MDSVQIENKLIKDVTNYLRTKFEIPISIPSLHESINMKINLKFLKIKALNQIRDYNQYIGEDPFQPDNHRYETIIFEANKILNAQKFDVHRIDHFMALFIETVDHDIEVMQKNEAIRSSSHRIRERIYYRTEQLANAKKKISDVGEKIHDKEDILSFIAVDLKNFLNIEKSLEEDCQAAKKIEVFTPLKIDNIYNMDLSNDDDYFDHYEPLLQVLMRLKGNIINLYKQVQQSEKSSMPLKSVNLLANCKNLLVELDQFLIQPNCAFNRLIFHVVSKQNQNITMLSQFYKQNMNFTQDVIISVFKTVYCGHLFPQRYNYLKNQLLHFEHKILEIFTNLKENDVIPPEKIKAAEKDIEGYRGPIKKLRSQIRIEKKILCLGKNSFMGKYTHEKVCKKLNLLLQHKTSLINLQALLVDSNKYFAEMKILTEQIKTLQKVQKQIEAEMDKIQDDLSMDDMITGEDKKLSKEDIFKKDYLFLQEKMIRVSHVGQKFQTFAAETPYENLIDVFEEKMGDCTLVSQRYLDLQTKLLNSFQHLLDRKAVEEKQAIHDVNKVIKEVEQYLQKNESSRNPSRNPSQKSLNSAQEEKKPIKQTIGFQIINQDEYSEIIKQLLQKIDTSSFLLKKKIGPQKSLGSRAADFDKQTRQKQVKDYKVILEWLLIIFEGSMDEKVLESIIDRLDYKENHELSIKKNVDKVNELLNELNKYSKSLEKITKQIKHRNSDPKSETYKKIIPKIYKISKQRLILNKLIEIIYYESLSVYTELKIHHKSQNNLQDQGIKVFDKWTYQYAIVSYQCLSRIKILMKQIEDVSNLPKKTKNYLCDEIYEPYSGRLSTYVGYNEQQLLKIILVMEKTMSLESELKKSSKHLKESINKNQKKKSQESEAEVSKRSFQFLQSYQKIQDLKALLKQGYTISNLEDLNKLQDSYSQDAKVARALNQNK